jgi:hypothetical protein
MTYGHAPRLIFADSWSTAVTRGEVDDGVRPNYSARCRQPERRGDVCTVDDDESVREPLRHLFWEFGFAWKKFAIADSAAAERRFP